jgi:hypothetical protein
MLFDPLWIRWIKTFNIIDAIGLRETNYCQNLSYRDKRILEMGSPGQAGSSFRWAHQWIVAETGRMSHPPQLALLGSRAA